MKHLVFALALFLAGCSGSPLSLLTGGGPNVAANVQAGKTNSQTLGTTNVREVHQTVKQAEVVEQSTNDNEIRTNDVQTLVVEKPVNGWWIIALVIWSIFLWQLPSPNEIQRWLRERT